ncbi:MULTISPECIES: LysR family transcriptional regulator [unclassified Modestobacter]|uniref:LysR family transcriptional regulator n=1 Tax=unclassified Modestobacter TaxID=2643866 RepID=UPI0022AA6F25|nr:MULTISPECIES: LysR family transcriptional regulator [unclassified Modestobacter]MCZ2809928.1 LysR family transcriptional regulator [Modestobacter sp. VKM Ac-2979]MCZ2842657.1 LysR family transcriptional regulator [Modestobacter sp. VKM Ac-2980]MCZ2847274.1 LysR family transcriptional regulator [Modestobacter sp. VKM Ac-2978]
MDVLAGCRAFVDVSAHGTFTVGAAAGGIPQSVASRRIAALEEHLGGKLFDRTSRQVRLTPFGRDLLPSARRLVELADAMAEQARSARHRPFRLVLPETCAAPVLAQLVLDARRHGLHLELENAGPTRRSELAHTPEVGAAVVAVPPEEAGWQVPLGLAGRTAPRTAVVHLETFRPGRTDSGPRRRIWVQPEDDVPHVRDRLTRLRDAVGLHPGQLGVARSLVTAAAQVLGSADVLLCSAVQATELGLHWRPLGELAVLRGYDVAGRAREDVQRLRGELHASVGRCLGVPEHVGPPA